jgi:hypothetical protein
MNCTRKVLVEFHKEAIADFLLGIPLPSIMIKLVHSEMVVADSPHYSSNVGMAGIRKPVPGKDPSMLARLPVLIRAS